MDVMEQREETDWKMGSRFKRGHGWDWNLEPVPARRQVGCLCRQAQETGDGMSGKMKELEADLAIMVSLGLRSSLCRESTCLP